MKLLLIHSPNLPYSYSGLRGVLARLVARRLVRPPTACWQQEEQLGREEEAARRKREAAWLEKTSARDIVRKGRFWLK